MTRLFKAARGEERRRPPPTTVASRLQLLGDGSRESLRELLENRALDGLCPQHAPVPAGLSSEGPIPSPRFPSGNGQRRALLPRIDAVVDAVDADLEESFTVVVDAAHMFSIPSEEGARQVSARQPEGAGGPIRGVDASGLGGDRRGAAVSSGDLKRGGMARHLEAPSDWLFGQCVLNASHSER